MGYARPCGRGPASRAAGGPFGGTALEDALVPPDRRDSRSMGPDRPATSGDLALGWLTEGGFLDGAEAALLLPGPCFAGLLVILVGPQLALESAPFNQLLKAP